MTREEAKEFIVQSVKDDVDIAKLADAIEAIEQEPCEDHISRADAVAKIQMNARRYSLAKEFGGMGQVEWSDFLISIEDALNILRDMPSVKQESKTGHWIEQIDHEENCRTLICSNCDRPALHDGNSIWASKFCPHCGARMSEVSE